MARKKTTIKVATSHTLVNGEFEEVEAEIYGEFAIHAPLTWDTLTVGERYALTHVKSGYRAPHGLSYKYQIQGLIAVLSDLDWDFTSGDAMPKETKEEAKERCRRFRKLSKKEQREWSYRLVRPVSRGS